MSLVEYSYTVEDWDIAKDIADTYYGSEAAYLCTHTSYMYDDMGYNAYVCAIDIFDSFGQPMDFDLSLPAFYAIEDRMRSVRTYDMPSYLNVPPFNREAPDYRYIPYLVNEYLDYRLGDLPARRTQFDLTKREPKVPPTICINSEDK